MNYPSSASTLEPAPSGSPRGAGWALIACGVLSLLAGTISTFFFWYVPHLALVALVVAGAVGALIVGKSNRTAIAVFAGLQLLGALLTLGFVLARRGLPPFLHFIHDVRHLYIDFAFITIGAIGVIILGIVALVSKPGVPRAVGPAQPAGYDANGQPFYPIVGYRADGSPVTADQAPGYQPAVGGLNSMAIVSLVCLVIFAPLAIPFGHVARSQIRRTGEQGGGMALAALIVGYVSLVGLVVGGVIFAITLNSLNGLP